MKRERWEDLVSDYLDGTLTSEERDELVAELRANPDALRYLLAASTTEMACAVARGQDSKGAVRPAPMSTRRRNWRLSVRSSPKPWTMLLVAAGVLVGVVGMVIVVSEGTGQRDTRVAEHRATPRVDVGLPKRSEPSERTAMAPGDAARKAEEDRLQAEKARREAEAKLAALQEAAKKAEEARRAALAAQAVDARKKADEELAQVARMRKEEEERLARLKAEEAAKEAAAKAVTEPKGVEPLVGTRQGAPATKAALAKVVRVEGEAFVIAKGVRKQAVTGQEIGTEESIETSLKASVVEIRFGDESRLEMDPGSLVRDFNVEGGKRLLLERGTLRAEIKPQPKGRPLILATPHGEARVLGTTLRLHADPDSQKGTRLEVDEGKVQLRNLENKTVLVESGRYAVAAAGVELVAKRMINLLADGGFEGGGKGWQTLGDPGRVSVVKAGHIRSGSRALQLIQVPQSGCKAFQELPVVPGSSYEVSGWGWSEKAAGPWIKLTWQNAEGEEVAPFAIIPAPQRPQTWARYTSRVVAPPKAARLIVAISASDSADTGGTAWFDDVEVRPVE